MLAWGPTIALELMPLVPGGRAKLMQALHSAGSIELAL